MDDSFTTQPEGTLDGKREIPRNDSPEKLLDPDNEYIARSKKEEAIRNACDLRDLDALVSYAISHGGLLNDDLRRSAWPIFLRSDRDVQVSNFASWEDLPSHGDEDQVQLDVNRSFVYYPQCAEDELSVKKDELSTLIRGVLRKYPMLCYFQGYHDIVQVLLLVLGEKEAAPAVTNISLFRIRDYMLPSLSPALKHLQLIPAIIEKADPALREHLGGIKPFFALAATLTLYAHDIQEYSDIARLFDFLLATEPVVSIYLFAAIILSRKKELLEIPADEPEMLHFTLSKLPQPLDLDSLISSAMQLFNDYPPESLPFGAWKRISQHSVLKSSRDPFNKQTRDEAIRLLEKQEADMANRGYDVVVDVDAEGDLGHTDLQEDLEFHPSNFENDPRSAKVQQDSAPFLGAGTSRGRDRSPGGTPSKHAWWSIHYYSQFFDVDTNEVLRRCVSALYPRTNFLDVLEGNADLYGPFWIATTVVVILFLTGTISQWLSNHNDKHFEYDFTLLSGAAGLVYGYTGVIPIALWGALRWFGSSTADLIECWALYGYSNLVWIAIALVSWSPLTALNWALVGVGFGWTVFFLLRNLYPVLSATDAKTSKILLILVIVLHAGFAIAIKILFFAHASPVSKKNKDHDDDDHDDKRRML
ncbi:hypothetical protein CNMCM6069_000459 [Aspergillus lentulus]|nr:hypothetical protein CNMCM6069_000459 [Aspergillus lentulus]KAF4179500.1 hypothetical protein CNMCM8060_002996 [Aspergillus lentulus]KAF4197827.1 hypothetical protein CNMCM8694_001915 [Aspergillus lentulus]